MDRVVRVAEDESVSAAALPNAVGFPRTQRFAPRFVLLVEAGYQRGATIALPVVDQVEDALVVRPVLSFDAVELCTKVV